MSSKKTKKTNDTLKISAICIVAFAIGYYALNHVSTMEKPPLGNTVYIIGGCILMAVSALVLGFKLKKHFFPKKRKSSRHTFLDENNNTSSRRVE